MTEQEWNACANPRRMLEAIGDKASARKWRLLLCAWCRLNWDQFPPRSRSAVETAELVADGGASEAERSMAYAEALNIALRAHSSQGYVIHLASWAAIEEADLSWAASNSVSHKDATKRNQRRILLDLFGNSFRLLPPLPSTVLLWNDGAVRRLAQSIYDDRAFDRLPILADALLDAGCGDEELIQHCRSEGPHVRGCWAIDLVLGKT